MTLLKVARKLRLTPTTIKTVLKRDLIGENTRATSETIMRVSRISKMNPLREVIETTPREVEVAVAAASAAADAHRKAMANTIDAIRIATMPLMATPPAITKAVVAEVAAAAAVALATTAVADKITAISLMIEPMSPAKAVKEVANTIETEALTKINPT